MVLSTQLFLLDQLTGHLPWGASDSESERLLNKACPGPLGPGPWAGAQEQSGALGEPCGLFLGSPTIPFPQGGQGLTSRGQVLLSAWEFSAFKGLSQAH